MVRVLAVLALVLLPLLPLYGACTGQCQGYSDCPASQYCFEGTCRQLGSGDGGLIVVPYTPNDGGTDGGVVDAEVTTEFPVLWMKKDPRPGTNQILLPAFDATNNIDQIDALDLGTSTIGATPVLNLNTLVDPAPPCNVDEFVFEAGIDEKDESWMVCGDGDLRIYFDEAYTQPALDETPSVNHGIAIASTGTSTGTGGTDVPRRAWFARGGATLAIFQIDVGEDQQQVANFRERDTITVTFTAITQLYQIGSVTEGDTLLVVDRGATPRIVPLLRTVGSEEWVASSLGLEEVPLPAGTHAVVFIGTVDPNGAAANEANVMTIEPEAGRLGFYNYSGNTLDPVGVEEIDFESEAAYQKPAPDSDERLLLEKSPNGQYMFYAHQGSPRLWRLPLSDDATANDVLRYTFSDEAQVPTGIVPVSDTSAWVSVPSELRLYRVTFGANN